MGTAQVAAGLSQGLPVGASVSRTAVNDAMGARSQIAGLLAAGAVVLVLLFLTGPIADLPKAVLGAVIVAAAIGLVEPAAWRRLADADHVELTIAAVTTVGVVAVGVLEAIVFAAGLSIVDVVRRSAQPHDAVLGWVERLDRWADVAVHRDARVVPGVVVYRLDDRLFFANQSYVKARVREAIRGAPSAPHDLVFDAEGMTHVDSAGLDALGDLCDDLARNGVTMRVARMNTPVRERLDDAGIAARIGRDRFYPTVHTAVRAAVHPGRARITQGMMPRRSIWRPSAAASCRKAELGHREEEFPTLAEFALLIGPRLGFLAAHAPCSATYCSSRGTSEPPYASGMSCVVANGCAAIWMCSNPASRSSGASLRGRDGCVRCLSHAASTRCISSSSAACQETVAQSTSHTTTRPPGRSARRISASAAGTSWTYSKTWTARAWSKLASGTGSDVAFASWVGCRRLRPCPSVLACFLVSGWDGKWP